MKRQWYVLILALAVSACSSISRDMAYSGEPGTAFLLVVADGMFVTGSKSFAFDFRRIAPAAHTLSDDYDAVLFDGMGDISGDEFSKPPSLKTTVRFGGQRVASGDYAFIARIDNASYGMSNSTYVNCYALGTAVFRLQDGAVNVVRVGDVRGGRPADPETTKAQVAAVLAGYPKVTAPIVIAEPIGTATFPTGKNLFGGDTCNPKGTVTFTSRPHP